MHYKSKSYYITSIYTLYAFVNKYGFNLFLKTAREGAVFILKDRTLSYMATMCRQYSVNNS